MTGFEIAGVVLGVLPLLMSGGEKLKGQFDSAMKAHSVAKTDDSIRRFYDEFIWEIYEMKNSLETIIGHLPNVPPHDKERIFMGVYNDWYKDPIISDSLATLLGSEDNFYHFERAVTEILALFCKLIGERSAKLPGNRLDHTAMCESMRTFQSSEAQDWGFFERRKFFREEGNRRLWLKSLGKWNKRLRRVLEYSKLNSTGASGHIVMPTTVTALVPPQQVLNVPSMTSSSSAQLRALSRRLFTALATFWPLQCQCGGPTLAHKACFCLQNCIAVQEGGSEPRAGRDSGTGQATTGTDVHSVEFRFLVSDLSQITGNLKPSSPRTGYGSNLSLLSTTTTTGGNHIVDFHWHEATVKITSSCSKSTTNSPSSGARKQMKQEDICNAIAELRQARPTLAAFHLDIEDLGHTQNIFTPNIAPAELQYGSLLPANITLDNLFEMGGRKPGLAIRLRLASILAKSLFQLHESPWPSSRWCKTNIAFFYKSSGEIDYSRPFLTIPEFENATSRLFKKDDPDPSLMHKSPGILKLGTLLIELFNWKRIEDCQLKATSKKRQHKSSGNSEILIAIDALNKMRASRRISTAIPGYLELIGACLTTQWISLSGKEAGSLDNEATRTGFYQMIIKPLQEIEEFLENGKNISLVNKIRLKTL